MNKHMNKELQSVYDSLQEKWLIVKHESNWEYTQKVINNYWVSSNLNLYCSLLVRTKKFLDWFGDWEKYPDQASKVVDEFWEPKLVWHWTNKKFEQFNQNENWIYFCDFEIASRYAITRFDVRWGFCDTNNCISNYWVFLNLRNPMYTNKIKYWDLEKETNWRNKENDGVLMYKTRDSLWTYDQYFVKSTDAIMLVYK